MIETRIDPFNRCTTTLLRLIEHYANAQLDESIRAAIEVARKKNKLSFVTFHSNVYRLGNRVEINEHKIPSPLCKQNTVSVQKIGQIENVKRNEI